MKPLTTEDFVRRIVGTTLRSGAWRGRALCVLCLERLAVEELGRTFKATDVHKALAAIREKPGAPWSSGPHSSVRNARRRGPVSVRLRGPARPLDEQWELILVVGHAA